MDKHELLLLVKEYYKDNLAGGVLHIVLDDGNLKNKDIKYCLEEARKVNDERAIVIAEEMLKMSITQRKFIYNK